MSSQLYRTISKQVNLVLTSNTQAAQLLQATKQHYKQTKQCFILLTHHVSLKSPENSSYLTRNCSSGALLRYLPFLEELCICNLCFNFFSANAIEGITMPIAFTPFFSNQYIQNKKPSSHVLPENLQAGFTRSSTGRRCLEQIFSKIVISPLGTQLPNQQPKYFYYLKVLQSLDHAILCF